MFLGVTTEAIHSAEQKPEVLSQLLSDSLLRRVRQGRRPNFASGPFALGLSNCFSWSESALVLDHPDTLFPFEINALLFD